MAFVDRFELTQECIGLLIIEQKKIIYEILVEIEDTEKEIADLTMALINAENDLPSFKLRNEY